MLALVLVVAVGIAWWMLPGPVDVEGALTPPPGAVSPPELPPVDRGVDESGEGSDSDADGTDGGDDLDGAFDGESDTDADGEGLGPRTADGLPIVLAEPFGEVVPSLPAESRVLSLVGRGATVLAVVASAEGSAVQALVSEAASDVQAVALDGVSSRTLLAARARDPVWAEDRWLLLAELAGSSQLWELDEATLVARTSERPESDGRLQHLSAAGDRVAVVSGERSVWMRDGSARRADGGLPWSLREGGARAITSLDVDPTGRVVGSRAGEVFLLDPRFSVARSLGLGSEPALLGDSVLLVRGGSVWQVSGGEAVVLGPVRGLAGRDLVVDGETALWLRPDGLLGRLQGGRVDAIDPRLDTVEALGADNDLLYVLGTDGPGRRLLIGPLPQRRAAILPADLRSSPP